MTSIQRKSMHSWQIIVLSTGVGILFALAVSWGLSIYFQNLPSRIPPPPSKAEPILAAKDVDFGRAMLLVRTIDGESYQYYSEKWEPLSGRWTDFYNKECDTSEIQLIQTYVGKISNCIHIQTVAELGSIPPLISYAITPDGDLWELRTYHSFKAFTVLILISLTLLGLFWGVVIVKAQREQTFNISILAFLTLGITVVIIGIISLFFF